MLKIVFDITSVVDVFRTGCAKSGIFFTAYNLFLTMMKRDDVQLFLYVSPEKYASAQRFKNELYPDLIYVQDLSHFKLICRFNQKCWNLHQRYFSKKRIRKIFSFGIFLSQILLRKFARKYENRNLMSSADAYFSPASEVPSVIRQLSTVSPYIMLHDAIPFFFPENYPKGWDAFLRNIINGISASDFFFCNSQCTQNDFEKVTEKINKKNSVVAPLAVSSNFKKVLDADKVAEVKRKYGIHIEKKYVFSLCTIEPRKNLIRAVKSFLRFVRKNKVEDLVWVLGGGYWESFIEILSKEIQSTEEWKKYVIRIGYVDDADLPSLYSGAEWFVYTSQYEGFGLPPLEAMRCGCPVVVSRNSSLPEVVGNAGLLIDWDSDEQHVQAYEKYYFDHDLRNICSEKGLEQSKKFTWEKTVDLIVSIMKCKKITQSQNEII